MDAKAEYSDTYDVVIIGAGVFGAAVARDCSQRGLTVALVEQDDIGAGATDHDPGLLGPYSIRISRSKLQHYGSEQSHLLAIAPNLVYPIPIWIPSLDSDSFSWYTRSWRMARWLGSVTSSPSHQRVSGEEFRTEWGAQFSNHIKRCMQYLQYGTFANRLAVLNVKSAVSTGAQLYLGTRATRIEFEKGQVSGVTVEGKRRGLMRAKIVVNATNGEAFFDNPFRFRERVHLVFARHFIPGGVLYQTPDSLPVSLIPHGRNSILSCLARESYSPDCEATLSDANFLLRCVSKLIPEVDSTDVVRASIHREVIRKPWGEPVSEGEHRGKYIKHSVEGKRRMYSIIGAHLFEHRALAAELTNQIARKLSNAEPVRTHLESLPGCTAETPWEEESKRTGVDGFIVRNLMIRHGSGATDILERMEEEEELREMICPCDGIVAAEIEYVFREEWAKTLASVGRRTGLGGGRCVQNGCLERADRFLRKLTELECGPEQFYSQRKMTVFS